MTGKSFANYHHHCPIKNVTNCNIRTPEICDCNEFSVWPLKVSSTRRSRQFPCPACNLHVWCVFKQFFKSSWIYTFYGTYQTFNLTTHLKNKLFYNHPCLYQQIYSYINHANKTINKNRMFTFFMSLRFTFPVLDIV